MASSPFVVAATALKQIIDTEFEPEHITAVFDNPHDSLGFDGVEVGIYPVEDGEMSGNALVNETFIEVKFLDLWTREINPHTVVDPTRITDFAERFRNAVRVASATDAATGQVWYFRVTRVRYPNDPTGNKTRFVATVKCFGNNAGLVETSG